ncbi:diguanylate cyclase [Vibrio sp. TH_r3]|uniref:sensor domain-containing diguanylate cyclase n=1 Tax=Vibrio sp. TH_r3 TaxID=3082084 RepID=UPI0029545D76|nr:diguanylate cyclase [Vibrio sp. TH_r3]MDV7105349.1 diguanylate cyclase [Vibrio sp. TH_r3]
MRILVLLVSLLAICVQSSFASPVQISRDQAVLADDFASWYRMPLLAQPVDLSVLKNHIESAPKVGSTFGEVGAFALSLEVSNSHSQRSNQVVTINANYLDQGWGFWQSSNGHVEKVLNFDQLNGEGIRQLHKQSFILALNAKEKGTLFLYVEAQKFPTAIHVTLQSERQFYANLFRDNTLTLGSIAVMLTLGMIALFGYLRTLLPVTLACAGYVGLHGVGWFAASGAWGYLLPTGSLNPVYFGIILFPFAVAFASYYTRLLFNFPQHFLLTNRWFKWFGWFCITIGLLTIFVPFSLAFLLSHLIAAVWVPTMIVTGILMLKKKDFIAKYYLIGSCCYGISLAYYVLVHFKQLPFHSSMETLVVVALAIDCFCILLSLTEWLRLQQRQYQETYVQSRVDSLTGLGNRLGFNDAIKQLKHRPYCLVFIDCDGLKSINDTYGHDGGDRFLKKASYLMQTQLEDLGPVYRTGGDEFVWLVKVHKPQHVEALYSKVTQRIIDVEVGIKGSDWPMAGLSFGIATSFECRNFSDCLILADKRMYQHKRAKQVVKA